MISKGKGLWPVKCQLSAHGVAVLAHGPTQHRESARLRLKHESRTRFHLPSQENKLLITPSYWLGEGMEENMGFEETTQAEPLGTPACRLCVQASEKAADRRLPS